VQSTLVDTGIIVALLSRNDRYHAQAVELLRQYEGLLFSTWPVIAEACALVPEHAQVRVLEWMIEQGLEIFSIDDGAPFIQNYMADYRDLPCDFADASLVYAAWRTGVREIWTIDEDFRIYRLPDKSRLKVIPGRG
jgi:predicted nucleic acid-binding protein